MHSCKGQTSQQTVVNFVCLVALKSHGRPQLWHSSLSANILAVEAGIARAHDHSAFEDHTDVWLMSSDCVRTRQ